MSGCGRFCCKSRLREATKRDSVVLTRIAARSSCLKSDQGQLFYEDAVPEDHLVRKIDAALDLSWLRGELGPHYSSMGRPSIDPELVIRMLVVGYVFAIRSERLICREVQVNLAYRSAKPSPPTRPAAMHASIALVEPLCSCPLRLFKSKEESPW
jgi:hypothetical protein